MNEQAQHPMNEAGTFPFYLLTTIMQMRDARANGDVLRAFSLFEDALQGLIPYAEVSVRKKVEADIRLFDSALDAISNNKELSTTERQNRTLELKNDFMRAHRFYLFSSLSRTKVVRIEEDGEIDFNKTTYEELQGLVQSKKKLELTGDADASD